MAVGVAAGLRCRRRKTGGASSLLAAQQHLINEPCVSSYIYLQIFVEKHIKNLPSEANVVVVAATRNAGGEVGRKGPFQVRKTECNFIAIDLEVKTECRVCIF